MKKTTRNQTLAVLLAGVMLLSACGIANEDKQTQDTHTDASVGDSPSSESQYTQTTAEMSGATGETPARPDISALRIDGSTSAIPLEAGLRATLAGISHGEAKAQVNHTKTHEAFSRLLQNAVDLIITVPISAEQQKEADSAQVELACIPIAMEGFVFVVNAENPVDTLTSEQIRQIYAGEITNWSEVGGLDEPIVPYQRNSDSGSQNYMVEFMGDTPLMPVSVEQIPGFMGAMLDAVSVYDNARQAIGYSVYSYAAQMYANENSVKFIQVDGIAPSKETFSDKSYPLLSTTCIYFDNTRPEEDMVRIFAEWCVSPEGQDCVLRNGYVPVADVEIPPAYLPYIAVGNGKARPEGYQPNELHQIGGIYDFVTITDASNPRKTIRAEINCLQDKALEEKINAWIASAYAEINAHLDAIPDFNWNNENERYVCQMNVLNGYLSILIAYSEEYTSVLELPTDFISHNRIARTAMFDLIEGRQLMRFSDLFYAGEDFVPAVNNEIASFISHYYESNHPDGIKFDFSGLLGDIPYFTEGYIVFNPDSAYFYYGPQISYMTDPLRDASVLWEYRDARTAFEPGKYGTNDEEQDISLNFPVQLNTYPVTKQVLEQYKEENGLIYTRIKSSRFLSEAEIEAINADIKIVQDKAVDMGYETLALRIEDNNLYTVDFTRFAMESPKYFDKDTLELLTIDDLFDDGWQDYCDFEVTDQFTFEAFYVYDDKVNLYMREKLSDDTEQGYGAELPLEMLKERYR